MSSKPTTLTSRGTTTPRSAKPPHHPDRQHVVVATTAVAPDASTASAAAGPAGDRRRVGPEPLRRHPAGLGGEQQPGPAARAGPGLRRAAERRRTTRCPCDARWSTICSGAGVEVGHHARRCPGAARLTSVIGLSSAARRSVVVGEPGGAQHEPVDGRRRAGGPAAPRWPGSPGCRRAPGSARPRRRPRSAPLITPAK